MKTQETQSATTEVIPMQKEENWKAIKDQQQKEAIIKFREELSALQNKYLIEIIPRITITGDQITSHLVFNPRE